MEEYKGVEIEFIVKQIKTMADGSINVTINLPHYCLEHAKVMLGWHDLLCHGVLAVGGKNDK